MLNNCTIHGRLVKDLEVLTSKSGNVYSRFTLACERSYKDSSGQRQTDFFNCLAWNVAANTLAKVSHQGDEIIVNGPMFSSSYKDKNGVTKYSYTITVEKFDHLGRRSRSQSEAPAEPLPNVPLPSAGDVTDGIDDFRLPFGIDF